MRVVLPLRQQPKQQPAQATSSTTTELSPSDSATTSEATPSNHSLFSPTASPRIESPCPIETEHFTSELTRSPVSSPVLDGTSGCVGSPYGGHRLPRNSIDSQSDRVDKKVSNPVENLREHCASVSAISHQPPTTAKSLAAAQSQDQNQCDLEYDLVSKTSRSASVEGSAGNSAYLSSTCTSLPKEAPLEPLLGSPEPSPVACSLNSGDKHRKRKLHHHTNPLPLSCNSEFFEPKNPSCSSATLSENTTQTAKKQRHLTGPLSNSSTEGAISHRSCTVGSRARSVPRHLSTTGSGTLHKSILTEKQQKSGKMGRIYNHHQQPQYSNRWNEASPRSYSQDDNDPAYENSPGDLIRVSNNDFSLVTYYQDEGQELHDSESFGTSTRTSSFAAGTTATGLHQLSPFTTALKNRGLEMVEQDGDGNCLFRAVSLQVYGDSSNYAEVRKRCMDFMAKDEAHFSQFVVDEPFNEYIYRKRGDGVHGNNLEIQVVSELFNRPVEVFVPDNGATPINIFHAEYKTSDTPIRLSYHDGNHYNAVIDPLCPTAGLGLGLPGLEPGLADRLQVQKAVAESDELHVKIIAEKSHNDEIQTAMKESKKSIDYSMYKQEALAMSDLEATDFEIERAVLASSMESYQNTELGRKQSWNKRQQGLSSPPYSSHDRQYTTSEYSSVASMRGSGSDSPSYATTSSVAAASASAAAASSAYTDDDDFFPAELSNGTQDEYPPTVQELVMNGFELSKVVRAYELIGDSFDDLITMLMSSGS